MRRIVGFERLPERLTAPLLGSAKGSSRPAPSVVEQPSDQRKILPLLFLDHFLNRRQKADDHERVHRGVRRDGDDEALRFAVQITQHKADRSVDDQMAVEMGEGEQKRADQGADPKIRLLRDGAEYNFAEDDLFQDRSDENDDEHDVGRGVRQFHDLLRVFRFFGRAEQRHVYY